MLPRVTLCAVVLGLTVFSVAATATGAPLGAVKQALYEYPVQSASPAFGWAIANITPDKRVIVEVHLQRALPSRTFDVAVASVRRRPYHISHNRFPGALTTNGRGNGNCHVVARVRLDGGTHVKLRVRVTVGRTKYYVTRKFTAVPLKSRAQDGPTGCGGASPVLTCLSALATSCGTQITFSLSSAAQVQTRILNVVGRPIRTLCRAKDCEADTNTLLWNAQNDSGLAVPNGTYLVEVTARTRDGSQARALTQVQLSR